MNLQAKYLGYILGPGAGNSSWKEPIAKYQQRASAWTNLHLGFHCTAVAYNTFALPVLTYLAQLTTPPQEIRLTEEQTVLKTAPGPMRWVAPSDLWWLRRLTGHPCSWISLDLYSQAAQTRVRTWDPACADQDGDPGTPLATITGKNTQQTTRHHYNQHQIHGHCRRPNNLSYTSTFQQRANRLRALMASPNQTYTSAVWRDWFSNAATLALEQTFERTRRKIGDLTVYFPRSAQAFTKENVQRWKACKREFQSRIYEAIHAREAPDPHARFREKLHRWKLDHPEQPRHNFLSVKQRTPNWQARSAFCRLSEIACHTAPRVHAAVFGAIWNRWCTRRRFQQKGLCRLCQSPTSEDSIEHYVTCKEVKQLASRRLRLDVAEHVNIHTFTCTNRAIATKELLVRSALLIYATYRALNYQRTAARPLQGEELYHALCQWLIEGARGHSTSSRILATAWTNMTQHDLPSMTEMEQKQFKRRKQRQ